LPSLNKIVQMLPALLLTGKYGHDTPKCEYECGHLMSVLYKILLSVLSDLTPMNQSCVLPRDHTFVISNIKTSDHVKLMVFWGVRLGGRGTLTHGD